jgi:hypothetical protein
VSGIRLRHVSGLSLLTCVFSPLGVFIGVWIAHRFSVSEPFTEAVVIAFSASLIYSIALRFMGRLLPLARRTDSKKKPPQNAEFLFYLFMTPQNCDALVGDLEERYQLIHRRFGRRHANFWYCMQTVISLGPIVWAWAKRFALKPVMALIGWAVAKGLIGHDGWLATLAELLKRVRQ